MTRTLAPPRPPRPTLRQQMEDQHEVLMALVTKQPRQAAQTVSLAERTTGPQSGDLYMKVDLVQADDETDADFIARMQTFMVDALGVRDALNAQMAAARTAGASTEPSA